jgi:phosphoglycerate kinase
MNYNIKEKYYYENIVLNNKKILCRFDFNVPVINNKIVDDFRISSAIPTIKYIISKKPKCIILASHFGRPINYDLNYSVEFLKEILDKYLDNSIIFLKNGISNETIILIEKILNNIIDNNNNIPIFLLENLRFYNEEINYNKIEDKNNNEIIKIYRKLADVFISDAFGCLHRNHMSICDMSISNKEYCYGNLIKREIEQIDLLLKSNNNKILGIIGGNKIKDKMPLIDSIIKINNSKLFITGGIAKEYNKNKNYNKNIYIMSDGFGNNTLDEIPLYIEDLNSNYNLYDIGIKSYNTLIELIDNADIIFWNGAIGVIENDIYKNGSNKIVKYLEKCNNKKIIIGGGETISLFNNKYNHIYLSTGGGALLEYIYNKILYNNNIVGLNIFNI